jgi:hypothetical protein
MSSADADAMLNIFSEGLKQAYDDLYDANQTKDKLVKGPYTVNGKTVYVIFDFVGHSVEITSSSLVPVPATTTAD